MSTTTGEPAVDPPVVERRSGAWIGVTRVIGPALLVAAGYVDPGNWGTDVAAGAQFGHRLIWVLVAATCAALFLQHLAANLGFATGCDLAQLLRERLSRLTRACVVPPLLLALAVTEVVEVLGVVIGVQMLTGWATGTSVLVATAAVLGVFVLPAGAARVTVYGCLGLVALVYVGVLLLHGGGGVLGGLRPGPLPPGGLPVAVGLVGAVVMPHNILLHSALARDARCRIVGRRTVLDAAELTAIARLRRASWWSTAVALGLAVVVNAAIVSVAARTPGQTSDGIADVLGSSPPTFGAATSALFAVTLIGAGLASSLTGGLVSANVLRQLVPRLRVGDAGRRVVCLVPAAAVVASGVPEVTILVWSQVALTLALPLVLVPLVVFSTRRDSDEPPILSRPASLAAVAVTAILCVAGIASVVSATAA